MTDPTSPRKARFNVGDRVRVVGPTARSHQDINTGSVTEVIAPTAVAIYRYRVDFADGNPETFFGFELELIEP